MSDHFRLRMTAAGRAALADGANIGTNEVRYTRMEIGSGYGPGGEAEDARAALRSKRDEVAVMGSTQVAGEIAVCAFVEASAAYNVREIGLFGKIGADGAEALHAFWTHPSDVFARAANGSQVIVAGKLAIGPLAAGAQLSVNASVVLQSQGLLPHWLLPLPHVDSASHTLPVTAASSAKGGTVSVAAGTDLSIGEPAAAGSTTGFIERLGTAAYQSADLPVNVTRYLRARVTAGALQFYVQGGTDADAAPDSLIGTPDALAGGGFPSTPLDARVAKIETGAAGTVPELTLYALDARRAGGAEAWSDAEDYEHPADAWGSDDVLYTTVQDSGPGTSAGAVNPTTDADESHWRPTRSIAKLRTGVPAKTDKLTFSDESAPGDPDKAVEIEKLPGALAPAGGVTTGKKYGLEALAGGKFALAAVASVFMISANVISVGTNWGVSGAVSPEPGTYKILAVVGIADDWAYLVDIELQKKASGSSNWVKIAGWDMSDAPSDHLVGVRAYSGVAISDGDQIRAVKRCSNNHVGNNSHPVRVFGIETV